MRSTSSLMVFSLLYASLLALLALLAGACSGDSAPEPALAAGEPTQGGEALHLIYLHGRIVEGSDGRHIHPRLGLYDQPAVAAALAAGGASVTAEIRPAGQSVQDAAASVVEMIEGLLGAGVEARNIAVIGHSRGGVITQQVSTRVLESEISYVVLAGCFPGGASGVAPLHGRLISIFDRSDRLAISCEERFEALESSHPPTEVTLDTGLGHGLFYLPDQRWIEPVLEWLLKGSSSRP